MYAITLSPSEVHSEQAFSADGGTTREANWIKTPTPASPTRQASDVHDHHRHPCTSALSRTPPAMDSACSPHGRLSPVGRGALLPPRCDDPLAFDNSVHRAADPEK